MPNILTAEHLGHWTAWFEGMPEGAFGGKTREDAEVRLRANLLQNQYLEWHRD